MNSLAMPFALPWLVFGVTWILLAPIVVLVHALVRRPLARVEPTQRAVLLLALALLPLIVAVLVVVLGFAPAVGGFMVNGHCHPNTGCHPHVPSLQASIVEAVWFGTLIVLGSFAVLWCVGRRLRRSLGLTGALRELAPAERGDRVSIVETDTRFAYCIGLLRPRIVVSSGLIARLTRPELEAVLAHERGHAARFDNLRQWLASVSLWPLPHALRRALLRDLAAANDESCDGRAAELAGRVAVAGALASFDAQNAAVSRSMVLNASCADLSPTGVLALITLAYALCTLPALDATHYGAELVLRWLA
jgi:Zn-dependent protease with chaperone function